MTAKNPQRDYWDKVYSFEGTHAVYDGWLDKYISILSESKNLPILDLGCGDGVNAGFLIKNGFSVEACDLSENALKRVKDSFSEIKTHNFDMLESFPFDNESYKIIISDLSIHYYNWQDTVRIISEIWRVLKKGGNLFIRVNSTSDIKNQPEGGSEIEKNLFNFKGHTKRFFTEEDLRELFSKWSIISIDEYATDKYGSEKEAIEANFVKA